MKNIIVTGSASGFGLLTVKTLAKKGYRVFATMRNMHTKNAAAAKSIQEWASEQRLAVDVVELDVTSEESVNTAVAEIAAIAGTIDVVINNAGVLIWGLSETVSTRQLEHIFQVNVFGSDRVNKAVLPYMHRQNSGLLIQLSSGLSRLHLPYLGAYSAAKAAIDTLAETLQYELLDTGIESIIIQPGVYTATDLIDKLMPVDNISAAKPYGNFEAKLKSGIGYLFAPAPGSREPQEVAELIATMIETPHGKRHTFTAIGIGDGQPALEAINESTEKFSRQVQDMLGIRA